MVRDTRTQEGDAQIRPGFACSARLHIRGSGRQIRRLLRQRHDKRPHRCLVLRSGRSFRPLRVRRMRQHQQEDGHGHPLQGREDLGGGSEGVSGLRRRLLSSQDAESSCLDHAPRSDGIRLERRKRRHGKDGRRKDSCLKPYGGLHHNLPGILGMHKRRAGRGLRHSAFGGRSSGP